MIANTPNTMKAIAAAMYQPVNLFADWTTVPESKLPLTTS